MPGVRRYHSDRKETDDVENDLRELPVHCAAALAVVMLVALCGTLEGQEFAGREKLRAHSNEFRKEVIRVTDSVYLAVGYSART
jgi:hypothetical protein